MIHSLRRPGERRDPYAAASRLKRRGATDFVTTNVGG
jgi:hypothetical protein